MVALPSITQYALMWLKLSSIRRETAMVFKFVIASGPGKLDKAVLSPTVKQVTLKESPDSYASLAEDEDYKWPLSSFVPGVLSRFDLPDCYRELAGRKLRQA